MEAAGAERWQGVPPGSVIGHVHFYVGDIPRAEAFYHAALGFDKVIWSWPGALFVSAGRYHHHVGLNTWAAGSPAASEDDVRLLEWELVVPRAEAIEGAAMSLEENGYAIERTPGGDVLARDPWGITARLTTGSDNGSELNVLLDSRTGSR